MGNGLLRACCWFCALLEGQRRIRRRGHVTERPPQRRHRARALASQHTMANYLGSWLKYMARLRLAPYVPAPTIVCNTMLELAALKPGEIVCDLGSGDGRLLRHAVHSFGAARATGYELDENWWRPLAISTATMSGLLSAR